MPSRPRFLLRPYWPVGLVLLAGLVFSGGVGWELHREAVAIDHKRMDLRVEEVMDQLDDRVEKTEQLLHQLQDYLAWSGEDRERVFREWCGRRGLSFNFPWLHGIAVATNRHAGQWRGKFPDEPAQWSTNDWKTFKNQAIQQPIDCAIALKSGVTSRKQFLADYDLRGLMRETNNFSIAAHHQLLRMSGRQTVMRDARGNPLIGTLFFAAVHPVELGEIIARIKPKTPAQPPYARWLLLDAMIIAPLNFQLLERAVWDGKESDLAVELFSSTNQTAETWLNVSTNGPHAADAHFQPYLSRRVKWPMYGRRFSMFIYTTPLFESQSPRRMAWVALSAGTGVTLLATVLAGVSRRAHRRQERMAVEIIEARDALAAAGRERVKLGHDLHDGAIQSLYAVQLGLTRTAEDVEASLPGSARVLDETRERVDEVIAELRRFLLARESGEESMAPVGLDRVLAAMIQRLQATTSAELEFHADPGAAERLSLSQAVQLTQIARSALANCLRHAQARRVKMELRHHAETVCLEIADDGIGFDPQRADNGGMGLRTMQARATEAGGTLAVETRPGAGTRIVVRVNALAAASPESIE